MQIQKLKSSKLFYNKWPYKIECSINGASRLSYLGASATRDFCLGKSSTYIPSWMPKTKVSLEEKKDLLEFTSCIEPFLQLKGELQTRAEGRRFNIYCKDRVLLDNIYAAIEQWAVGVHGPTTEEELKFMLSNGHKKILRDTLPKDGYQYRIYLKTSWDAGKRIAFLNWADKFSETIIIADGTRDWFKNNKRWVYNPFIYVKDEKTLTMVGLFTSGHVKKVEEFILRENLVPA